MTALLKQFTDNVCDAGDANDNAVSNVGDANAVASQHEWLSMICAHARVEQQHMRHQQQITIRKLIML